ncbi:MAG TPA: GxxExxY protein [Gemmatimonadales bacterium]|nr:GxxExxY protein [Gemmatimonadales bacterium]
MPSPPLFARDAQTHAIIGPALTVHRELGPGFLEAVDQEALGLEFDQRQGPRTGHVLLPVQYKGARLRASYRVDVRCFGEVLVEVKALHGLGGLEEAQSINYLEASGVERGSLLNFGPRRLEIRRFILTTATHLPLGEADCRDLRASRPATAIRVAGE